MNEKLDPRLSGVSDNLGVLLDKALCEEEFRWELVLSPSEIMNKYMITDEKDKEIVYRIVKQLKDFINSRASSTIESGKNYKRANSKLTYDQAMLYREIHNL